MYPKEIPFTSPLTERRPLFPEFKKKLESALGMTRFTLLDEKTLRIDYPEDEILQMRLVNVDDSVFRVDAVLSDDPQAIRRICLFPQTGWNHENFFSKGCFENYTREQNPGSTIITFKER